MADLTEKTPAEPALPGMTQDTYPTAPADPSALINVNSSIISEEQIKTAFAEYITEKSYCCNRPKDPQNDITLEGEFSTVFKLRFKLNSYVESRSIEKREEKMLLQNNPTTTMYSSQVNQGYAGNMGMSGNPYDNPSHIGHTTGFMGGQNRGPMGTDFNYSHSMGMSSDPMGNFHNDPMDRGMGMGVGGMGYNQQTTMVQTQQFVAPQANMTAGIITNDLWAYNLQPAGDWWEGKREILIERRQEQCSHCSHMSRDTCFFLSWKWS
ncbi:uncharacterized protein LOC142349842 isoform X2 [Convolutriloba macropyga]|uniref:uncharacterized protein LOC142349842 isoform X2 n=1 Tax=Convolutriloba macropyga TaxID=536237 RepID=UPI003F523C48